MPTVTDTTALPTRRHVLQATAAVALAAPALVRAQAEPWRIGQTAALTGPLAFPFVEMNKGIAAAFKEVNDRGGIDGRPVELVSLDDGGAPDKAAENTLALLQKEQVFTMFACGGTTSVMGALKVLAEAKVPLIAPASGSDALRPFNPLVFHTRASYAQELSKIVKQLGSTGFTKCAVPYFDNPFGKATLAAFEAAAREHNNTQWKPFLIAETPEGIAKGVDEIAQWQPYSLISLCIGASGLPFFKALRQRVKAPVFSLSFLGSRPVLSAMGEASIGITVAQVVPNPANPAIPVVKAYQDSIRKMGGIEPGYSSLEGYVNARILLEGLRRAGRGATREKLVEALHSMRPYDLGGFEVRYGPKDHSGTDFVELTYFNGERFRR
ncbi:ABC transporter substrate-binding protein [Simplicispira lacusdiani]|uniref:ABC transporter substrate-binding protein n=1 Tax=Simplicispira lacusdiani TaxID=2213010 RepID=UPI000E730AF9|nr:ABC transporter substrate-binding protein [Simplicispira lacusdiani]